MNDARSGGAHRELFRVGGVGDEDGDGVEYGYSVTVCETPGGHLYPMGGRHKCDAFDCPARSRDAPETTLGTVGPIEMEWYAHYGLHPQEVVERWREYVGDEQEVSDR